ncbi:ankyrin repeat protein, putative [Trichomonas vaginalis G3]|uniref:Ankyrin repeat protein, putative n=1 Tax=Trichomonas vaginalis (strain ATCC PRA-98 / G3) TaxID=412133 RepID=A2FF71_TRIV3|nr:spectrin binding [Trichomonas vaginalis G3]EAX96438.1 ankyrin repeat protein, putative [Trichomonas vaginalis G3]KAI5482829.1 spectrin binding [Trichomonas vaginalis G3]|eukprot:XP_001309368.1 ankyrin repeat protein [Trichomonas vaginalis G3]
MDEHNIKIDLALRSIYNNIQSFFIYLDQANDINKCLVYSPYFHLSSLVEYLISNGLDINAKDEVGQTPLHFAADHNCKEITEIFISNGADINSKTQIL